MTVKTSKGKTFEAAVAYGPTFDGSFLICLKDGRRLPEIAADFDGLERIETRDAGTGDAAFEGFSALRMIQRLEDGSVRIKLARESAE